MKTSLKKTWVALATSALTIASLTGVVAAASALPSDADCKTATGYGLDPAGQPTANQTPQYAIKVVAPLLTSKNSYEDTGLEANFTQACNWFGAGMRFLQSYVPVNTTNTLAFQVTDSKSGLPKAGVEVTLRANKGYSGSNANVTVNGLTVKNGSVWSALDGGRIKVTTDSNGLAIFTVAFVDCDTYGGIPRAKPASLNRKPAVVTTDSPDCFSQFLPQINTQSTDNADFVEFHYYDDTGVSYAVPASAKIAAAAPVMTADNSVKIDHGYQNYALVGSTNTYLFSAFDATSGAPIRNTDYHVNANGFGSTANIGGGAGVDSVLSGKTDGFGTILVKNVNKDTVGEAKPSAFNVLSTGNVFSRTVPAISANDTTDGIETHFYAMPKPSAVVTAAGKVITVSLVNAQGKNAAITITGMKAASKTATSDAPTAFKFTVTKGVKTVKVVVGGVTVTKKVTIK
jgi:hypothetical protein